MSEPLNPDEDSLTIDKPKKERTQKQKDTVAKMQLALAEKNKNSKKAIKAGVVLHLNSGVAQNTIIDSSDEEEPVTKTKSEPVTKTKSEPVTKTKSEPKKKKEPTIIYQSASSSDEEIVIVKKKKKKKKTIIVEESESEEEAPKPIPKTRETKTQQNARSGFTVNQPKANPYYFAD